VAGRWLWTTVAEKRGPTALGACSGRRKPTRFTPQWSSAATPSRRGAARAGSSMAACEAPAVAVSFLHDSARMATGDRHALRWTEEGVGGALDSTLGRCEDAIERAVTGARCRGGNGQGGSRKREWNRGGSGVARGHMEEEEGAWPWYTLELGASDMSGAWSGGGSPGTTAPGHARGRQGKREKGESGGGWRVGRTWGGPS
jgi:hypothetical protein